MNRLVVLLLLLGVFSCGGPSSGGGASETSGTSGLRNEAVPGPVPPVRAPTSGGPRIVVLGDSLTSGLGLDPSEAYPALLQRKLSEQGSTVQVINAGVSGDTSSDGLQRLDWALEGDVELLVVALGANDGLRGLPPAQMRGNLQRIITTARQRGTPVLLIGMEAPPNFGERYASDFRRVFSDLASENHLTFVPFLLQGVAGVPGLNQPDGIHPTARGASVIADTLWPVVDKMIRTGRGR